MASLIHPSFRVSDEVSATRFKLRRPSGRLHSSEGSKSATSSGRFVAAPNTASGDGSAETFKLGRMLAGSGGQTISGANIMVLRGSFRPLCLFYLL